MEYQLVQLLKSEQVHPTHFLIVSFQFNKTTVTLNVQEQIKSYFYNLINNNKFSRQIGDDQDDIIFVTWKSNNKQSSLYYCTSRFEDSCIKQLSKYLVAFAYQKVLGKFELSDTDLAVNFVTIKNLGRVVNMETTRLEESIGNVAYANNSNNDQVSTTKRRKKNTK